MDFFNCNRPIGKGEELIIQFSIINQLIQIFSILVNFFNQSINLCFFSSRYACSFDNRKKNICSCWKEHRSVSSQFTSSVQISLQFFSVTNSNNSWFSKIDISVFSNKFSDFLNRLPTLLRLIFFISISFFKINWNYLRWSKTRAIFLQFCW